MSTLRREELLSRILQRKRSFADTAARRYRVALGKLLIAAGQQLRRCQADAGGDPVDQAAEAFRQAVARRTDSHYIGRLLGVMKAVIAEASRDPELGFLPGPQADGVATLFLDDLVAVFQEHMTQAMGSAVREPHQDLARCTHAFRGDMAPRIRRLNLDMVELYCQMHRSLRKELCVQSEPEPQDDCNDTVPQLIDAFGRGLLHPVDKYHGVEDCSMTKEDCFPRMLCAPVLDALRSYAIGADKYDATNKKFIHSIYKYCTKESAFHKACLSEYFEEQHVLKYLVAYLMHLLQLFLAPQKREAFVSVVNAGLRERHPEDDYSFTPMHCQMLLTDWAGYCLDKYDAVSARKRAAEILKAYLPEANIPEMAAEPACC